MPIHLSITADTVNEFDTLLARYLSPTQRVVAQIMPEIADTDAGKEAVEQAKTPARGRGKKADAASATAQDGSASETAPAATAAPVDPFVAATPAATAGAAPAESPSDAAVEGEVTVQHLKDAMADLLKAKSASVAMQVLEQATGCKSLTSGSPSVVEKAKDDPSIMRTALDALVAAKTAA